MSNLWLEQIPGDWRVIRGRFLVDIFTGTGDTVDADPDGEYPFYVRSDTPLSSNSWDFEGPAVLTAGDGAGVAKVFHLVDGKFKAHQRVYALKNFRECSPKFFYYQFSSLFWRMALDGSAKSTVDSVRRNMIADMPFAVPSVEEQRAITDYLDRETARIDKLIAKQEALIETLRERTVGVVSHAVWNGLDGDLPREATGIATVPAVPSHWRRLRNKVLLAERSEVTQSGDEELLSVSHLTGVTPRSEKNVTMFEAESNVGYRQVSPGDLVINTMWAWMGAMGISRHQGIVSPAYGVYSYRCPDDVHPPFFDYLYRTPEYVVEMTRWSRGITSSRLRLYPEVFLSLAIVVPPVEEQRQIADHLDAKTAATRALIDKAQRFIELAHERRAALITAAVTGEIDVRERVA